VIASLIAAMPAMVPGTIPGMHIVHLETGRHLYGGARQVLDLATALPARGATCTLVCPPQSAIAGAAVEQGVTVQPLPMHGDLDLLFIRRFRGLLDALRPDLVHVHSRRGAETWGGVAARLAGIPAVLTRRVDSPDRLGACKYRNYQRLIAISGAVRRNLQQSGLPDARIALIPSAVDVESCRPSWTRTRFQAEFGLDADALAVACVAQLIPRKGHATLLAAWPAICRAVPTARLLLFGTGACAPAIARQAAQPPLAGTVILAGFRPELREFLGRAHLLVHPARSEGLGLAVLEAQAAGLPVVACRAGGVPEIVRHDEDGLLVEPGDSAALAAAVVALLKDPGRRQAMGAAGHRSALQFGLDRLVESHLTLYRDLLDTCRRGGH
jgi:glycosyltransferase involved in cell wall biosynthesis